MNRLNSLLVALFIAMLSLVLVGQAAQDDTSSVNTGFEQPELAHPDSLTSSEVAGLNDQQLSQYLQSATTYNIDPPTMFAHSGLVDDESGRFKQWLAAQDAATKMKYFDSMGSFAGPKTVDFYREKLNDPVIKDLLSKADVSDFEKFFGSLKTFDQAVAAVEAWFKGALDNPGLGYVNHDAAQQGLKNAGFNIDLSYASGSDIEKKDNQLCADGQCISLDETKEGTSSLALNPDGTVDFGHKDGVIEDIRGAEGLSVDADGNFEMTSATSVTVDDGVHKTTIVNGSNIRYVNGTLMADRAEVIVTDGAITYNAVGYNENFIQFHVDKADLVYENGLKIYDVINTTFQVATNRIVIIPDTGNIVVHINDTNENSLEFRPITNLKEAEEELKVNVTDIPIPANLRDDVREIAVVRSQIADSDIGDELQRMIDEETKNEAQGNSRGGSGQGGAPGGQGGSGSQGDVGSQNGSSSGKPGTNGSANKGATGASPASSVVKKEVEVDIVLVPGANISSIMSTVASVIQSTPEFRGVVARESWISYEFDTALYHASLGTVNMSYGNTTEIIVTAKKTGFNFSLMRDVECVRMEPLSAYLYMDRDHSEKDFSVRNPVYGSNFSLCVKKQQAQSFKANCRGCGVVDFVANKVSLNGIADYMRRYYVQDAGLTSKDLTECYQGVLPTNASLALDRQMTFIHSASLSQEEDIVCRLFPNNFFSLKEARVGAEVHAFVKLSTVKSATDSLVQDFHNMSVGSVLSYRNVRILPPNHQEVFAILP